MDSGEFTRRKKAATAVTVKKEEPKPATAPVQSPSPVQPQPVSTTGPVGTGGPVAGGLAVGGGMVVGPELEGVLTFKWESDGNAS